MMEKTLRDIAIFMDCYLGDPMGCEYWDCCDMAGGNLDPIIHESFLASCANLKISQISWVAIHIEQNWAAWFSSQVIHLPLEGH